MKDEIYRKLREEIDRRMPVGLPSSPDGSDIAILKHVFTEEEAAAAIHLSVSPEPAAAVHKRMLKGGINITLLELEALLDRMYRKGAIMGGSMFSKPGRYSLAQFVIGIYEFQVDLQDARFAKHMEDYSKGPLVSEILKHRPYQMRTIPVRESLPPEMRVAAVDDVYLIIEKAAEPFVVIDCVCRQSSDLLNEPCRLSPVRNTCVMFGKAASYHLDRGTPSARRLTKSELFEQIKIFSKAGFIFQPANTRRPGYMCVCCGCCCHMLRAYKSLPDPAEYFTSNYTAIVQPDNCTGCSLCAARCQMDAVIVENKKARVIAGRCIGCGSCVTVCKPGAVRLIRNNKNHPIPRSSSFLYGELLLKKLGLSGILSLAWKALTGQKK